MRKIIGRPEPNRLPDLPLPLYVRSVGYNEAEPGWSEFFPAAEKNFVQIFWSVRGSAEFRIGQTRRIVPPESVTYHLPGEEHFHAALEFWSYHWFTLDGPQAVDFFNGYGYPKEAMRSGPCPVELFLQLETLMREMSPYSQRKMLSIATDILALAGNRIREETQEIARLVDNLIAAIQAGYANPGFNVNELAQQFGIHRTTVTRLFKKRMLMAPGEYLQQLRLQRALSLLREKDCPVGEVGDMVGIPHRAYFCRLIRRATGLTPKTYRERMPGI